MPELAHRVITLSRTELDMIEAAARAATQDEWKLGHTGTATVDAAVQWMEETIRKRTDPDLWMVFIGDPEGVNLNPAFTGNGPTSRANAEYLAMVQPRNMHKLLMFLRHQMGDHGSIAVPWPRDEET